MRMDVKNPSDETSEMESKGCGSESQFDQQYIHLVSP